jgi:SAM-dependent methyltransferase
VAFYDRIARRWDAITGERGGAFKRHVVNERLLGLIGDPRGLSILELGAGNGYFSRLLTSRTPSRRLVVSDASPVLLDIARHLHPAPGAEYLVLDAGGPFPFERECFDLILATMIFNEVRTPALSSALRESRRVLRPGGRLLATVLHPRFVHSLARRGQLRPARDGGGPLTMPGAKGLRLPVVRRDREDYESLLDGAGFGFEAHELAPTPKVLLEKPGAAASGKLPWGLLYECRTRA